jgi:ABC-type polysaccharide/polyol phosphate transport system ATPase subunit
MKRSPVIVVENITKYYNRHPQIMRRRGQKLTDYLISWFRKDRQKSRFLVLDNISFKIYPGETVGLIGSNGSGKSTLLRILTGITRPTQGKFCITGEYRELFSLNAGFNMGLSGRKNIYLYAAMKYIPAQIIDDKIDEIIEFSGLGSFIDEPVRTYSSGMRSRLGFSIIIHTLPDIIFIDEALSPGDEAFREKCNKALLDLRDEKKTIVIVSHSLVTLRKLCTRAIWLDGGKIRLDGNAKNVIQEYKFFQDGRSRIK